MYWIASQTKIGPHTFYTYNYFEVVEHTLPKKPWYNSLTRKINYPTNKELIVKALLVSSEDEFIKFYKHRSRL